MPEPSEKRLTHLDATGSAHMVDVTKKDVTVREARAGGAVFMQPATLAMIRENLAGKGDVLGVARIAGIMAAKRTSELIPLCHGLPLTAVDVDFEFAESPPAILIEAGARVEARTGVEMEALTAVTVAALTIYDMCKAVDREMTISQIQLLFKSGGRSGEFRRDP